MRRNSYFFIYILTIILSIAIFKPSHITTNMLSIFEHDKNIEKLQTINSFENSSTLFITIKGFNQQNLNRLTLIKKDIEKSKYIKDIKFSISKIEIPSYIKKNYYLLSDFKPISINNENIKKRVAKLKESLINSFLYQPIDKNDPFKLFKFNLFSGEKMTKNGYLTLGDYGYMITAKINGNLNNMESSKKIEKEITDILKDKGSDVVAFSTLFFIAQNSTYIKNSVHNILYISFALLFILFFITLRDYKVLLATSITLGSSIFVSLAISTLLFNELSIFTLAFGSAISSIAIDYLFHNYFHGQYLIKGINRSIFLAFFTTALGFIFLQFVSFPLISQLSIFALISLSFSYFQFTFIYPYFKFKPKKNRLKLDFIFNIKPFLSTNAIFIFSLVTIIYAIFNIDFDYNLKNLDYDNRALKDKQAIIQDNIPQKTTLLIEANSVNKLIDKAFNLQEKVSSLNSIAKIAISNKELEIKSKKLKDFNFKKLKELLNKNAKELGFKDKYFSTAYKFVEDIPTKYKANLKAFKDMGYEIIKRGDKFYTIATIDKNQTVKAKKGVYKKGVYKIDASLLIKNTTKNMFNTLLFYLFLSFLSIFIIIAFIIRKRTILALNFILFPISIIVLYLTFVGINIMHLFSIIIIVVAGIDYGIYMSSEDKSNKTKEAIFYSLLTSFSGFGILIFSSIGAMHSIGIVITLGILSILFLVLFLKSTS